MTMKKDGIQTRNRKISSKLKKMDSIPDSLSGLPSHPDFQMPPFWNVPGGLHHPAAHGHPMGATPIGHPPSMVPSSTNQNSVSTPPSQDGFNSMAFNPSYHGFHGFH